MRTVGAHALSVCASILTPVAFPTAVVAEDALFARLRLVVTVHGLHRAPALSTAHNGTGEFPEPPAELRWGPVVCNDLPSCIDHLSRDSRVGHGYGYPLVLVLKSDAALLPVHPATRPHLRELCRARAPAVEPPDAVALLGIEPRGHLRRDEMLYLLESMRLVDIVQDK